MKVGISTASLFNRLPNEEAVQRLNEWNIPCAEVFLTSYREYSKEFGKLIQKNKGTMEAHSVHVLNAQIEPQLFSDNARVKEDSFFWLDKAMEAGACFGAKYYTFHGIARYKKATRPGFNDDIERYAKGLAEIDAFCKDRHGIALALENVEWALANRPQFFSRVHEYLPNLYTVLDTKQVRISGYEMADYLESMQNIAHVHLSDVDENGRICLPGKGTFPFQDLFFRLRDKGFDGPVLIEVYKDNYEDLAQLKKSCLFLEELIYKYSL